MKEYIIVYGGDLGLFQERVNGWMERNYIPAGGVSYGRGFFHQAMVLNSSVGLSCNEKQTEKEGEE